MLLSDKVWCGWELINLHIKIPQFFPSLCGRGRERLFSSPAVSSYLSFDQKKEKDDNKTQTRKGLGRVGREEWLQVNFKKSKEKESNDKDNKS